MKSRLAIVLMLGVLPLAAQNSSLNGVVTDAHGAAVPASAIKITNEDTSATRATLTNDRGEYEVVQVPPGRYKLTAEKPGFRVHSTDVVLQTNTPSTLPPSLDPHEKVRALPSANTQTDTFFRTGNVAMSACDGGPCQG